MRRSPQRFHAAHATGHAFGRGVRPRPGRLAWEQLVVPSELVSSAIQVILVQDLDHGNCFRRRPALRSRGSRDHLPFERAQIRARGVTAGEYGDVRRMEEGAEGLGQEGSSQP
eukprot:366441-Chlamydomonas_euryale.AAC.27